MSRNLFIRFILKKFNLILNHFEMKKICCHNKNRLEEEKCSITPSTKLGYFVHKNQVIE